MTFSAGLKLTDLNDFIQPSQVCVKPPNDSTTKNEIANRDYERKKNNVAQINLDDCLACSGCITSAETVLISSQSKEEIFKAMEEKNNGNIDLICVSVSPQSVAALASKHGLAFPSMAALIKKFLQARLSVDFVYDLFMAKAISVAETCKEFFLERYKDESSVVLASSCPGWICYAEKVHPELLGYISKVPSPQQIAGILVKKVFHQGKQGQGITDGRQGLGKRIYHWSVMPCFDKKLEASRPDFSDSETGERSVDCVISTKELEEMMKPEKVDKKVGEKDDEKVDKKIQIDDELEKMMEHVHQFENIFMLDDEHEKLHSQFSFGSSSGGFWEYILHYWAQKICFLKADEYDIISQSVTRKSTDFQEHWVSLRKVTLNNVENEDPLKNDKTLNNVKISSLKVASVYGFRNIQNMVRRLKKHSKENHCGYAFIEVMACPSGCINGGGQVKPLDQHKKNEILSSTSSSLPLPSPLTTSSKEDLKQFCSDSEKKYLSTNVSFSQYQSWIQDTLYKTPLFPDKNLLRTEYHSIESSSKASSINVNNW